MTGAEIQNLLDVCSNSNCNMLIHPISLPDIISCKVCVNCEDVRAAISDFESDPSLAHFNSSLNKEKYLATYLNREFGFNYFWQDYADFLKFCEKCAPFDDCTKAFDVFTAWSDNVNNEQNYPLAVYLNINVGVHKTKAEWLQFLMRYAVVWILDLI
ncbi:MAG: hypothetical protein IPK10_05480 [Bacteroidetes bacterium]|nr:hypothetical protein [Bacteroidota bacterium]